MYADAARRSCSVLAVDLRVGCAGRFHALVASVDVQIVFGLPDAQEQRQAGHRDDRGDDVHQPRAVVVGDDELRDGEGEPATRIAGQISIMPRKPAKAQISQNGTISEKKGSCRPIMAESSSRSSPVTAARAMIGVPSAPNATGAVLAISDSPEAASGEKPRPIRIAASPPPACRTRRPFEERAEAEGDQKQLQAPVTRDVGDAVLQHLERAVLLVSRCRKMMFSTIQPIGSRPNAAPYSADSRHLDRHAEGDDRDGALRDEADHRRQVRPAWKPTAPAAPPRGRPRQAWTGTCC